LAGPNGTTIVSTPVAGPVVFSGVDPAVGTAITATASCPAGQVLLGGGANVTGVGQAAKNVMLRSSYPVTSSAWRTVDVVMAPLGGSGQVSVHPYVLCGKA
jgi:hypothetical protein